ncbi:MAG: hypothetical protein AAFV07_17670, partial [Bacteroidota bacterium]
ILSEDSILAHFGLTDYHLTSFNFDKLPYRSIFLASDASWLHLADSYFYTIWHINNLRERLISLSRHFDIFRCSIGDIDESFDFMYLSQGEIIRDYNYVDPTIWGKGGILSDSGNPFAIEQRAFTCSDLRVRVLTIAEGLGIDIDYSSKNILTYCPPAPSKHKF